ncbi:MAG: hypothetical protein DRO09_02175 [Thermoprotei archaeon]|mgnify:CR=1 FL=1|nr:MAG: hypothetical protein DRO09_02175 [Thermoprotei archaeon]
MRVRVEEEPLDHDVWGSLVDVDVRDEGEALSVLEGVARYVGRGHRVAVGGKRLRKRLEEIIDEMKRKGVKPRRRGERAPEPRRPRGRRRR